MLEKGWTLKAFGQRIGHILQTCAFQQLDVAIASGGAGTSNLTRISHDLGARLGAVAACRRASASHEGGSHEKGARPRLTRDFQGHKCSEAALLLLEIVV